MLGRRLISAAIIIALLIFVFWLDYYLGQTTGRLALIFAPILAIVAVMAAEEIRFMLSRQGAHPRFWLVLGGILTIMLFASAPALWKQYPEICDIGKLGWLAIGFAGAFGLIICGEMLLYKKSDDALQRIIKSIFIVMYVGLLGFFIQLRFMKSNEWGIVAMLSLVVTVKASDTFAYLVGRAIGKEKLAPILSPGKTIQGAIAALVFGSLGSLLVFFVLAPWITGEPGKTSLIAAILFGVVVTIAGIMGDLAESLIKRETDCKDSSSWLPGLGGVMDILDSLLAAAPAAIAFWISGAVGP